MKTILNKDLFKGEPISTTLYCRCGTEWRAHTRLRKHGDGFIKEVSELCPVCGEDTDVRMSSTDPETFTIRG